MCDSDCWEWPSTIRKADGRAVTRDGTKRYAYRVVYEAAFGALPKGLVLHHLCGNPACVNPSHMEACTQSDHVKAEIARGVVKAGDANVGQALKTECPQGHPYSGENLYVSPNGDRHCLECGKAAKERWQHRQWVARGEARRAAE